MPDGLGIPSETDDAAATRLHRRLAAFNRVRFTPRLPQDGPYPSAEDTETPLLEAAYLHTSRAAAAGRASTAPASPASFVRWFEQLEREGPGQGDPLFPWLATEAPRPKMLWFLAQEVAGEAGFEDLTALTQLRMPAQAKLEMARNFWDEMGRGQAKGMHGPMLERLAQAMRLEALNIPPVWQSLALANTMAGLAANRDYAFHAVGALGVIELTAPARAARVAAGLKRLGVAAADRHYFDLHAVLDVKHAAAWNKEVIEPLVADDPRRARAIAEGALMRLACGAACFARYREVLTIP